MKSPWVVLDSLKRLHHPHLLHKGTRQVEAGSPARLQRNKFDTCSVIHMGGRRHRRRQSVLPCCISTEDRSQTNNKRHFLPPCPRGLVSRVRGCVPVAKPQQGKACWATTCPDDGVLLLRASVSLSHADRQTQTCRRCWVPIHLRPHWGTHELIWPQHVTQTSLSPGHLTAWGVQLLNH